MGVTIAETLTIAMNSLTEDTWRRGAYFSAKGSEAGVHGHVCMCAHGAVQKVVNPAVRKCFAAFGAESKIRRTAADASACTTRALEGAVNEGQNGNWETRPDWVREDLGPYGNVEVHYLLGMVGLTSDFNDSPRTTLEMVHEKFRAAIKLAQEWGI